MAHSTQRKIKSMFKTVRKLPIPGVGTRQFQHGFCSHLKSLLLNPQNLALLPRFVLPSGISLSHSRRLLIFIQQNNLTAFPQLRLFYSWHCTTLTPLLVLIGFRAVNNRTRIYANLRRTTAPYHKSKIGLLKWYAFGGERRRGVK